MKILRPMIIGSATWPQDSAVSATTMAKIPATKVPSARLNPRLNVAPLKFTTMYPSKSNIQNTCTH